MGHVAVGRSPGREVGDGGRAELPHVDACIGPVRIRGVDHLVQVGRDVDHGVLLVGFRVRIGLERQLVSVARHGEPFVVADEVPFVAVGAHVHGLRTALFVEQHFGRAHFDLRIDDDDGLGIVVGTTARQKGRGDRCQIYQFFHRYSQFLKIRTKIISMP